MVGLALHKSGPFDGFHVGDLALELIVLAALVDLRIWRFPLLVLPVVGLTWFFVTDFISSGGNWTNVVTLLFGFLFFLVGLGFDGSDSRPYGFWIHFAAGSLIGGVFLSWWHTSDARGPGSSSSRSSSSLSARAFAGRATPCSACSACCSAAHFAIPEMFPYFGSGSARATTWARAGRLPLPRALPRVVRDHAVRASRRGRLGQRAVGAALHAGACEARLYN